MPSRTICSARRSFSSISDWWRERNDRDPLPPQGLELQREGALALDYKTVPHERKAIEPGRHIKVARQLAGTRTMPILRLDGRCIADSTLIIDELERRWPEPPLYPSDSAEFVRALALEEFFDEELGA